MEKGRSMRKMTILAAAAGAMLATAAVAQQQPPTPTSPAPAVPSPATPPSSATPDAGAATPAIRAVNIVDIEQLPKETQTKVNDIVAKGGEAGLKELRGSIDATPELASALKQKGLTSQNVIVASLDQSGVLTLVTRKKAG
jgi:hypothetical protein